MSTRGRCYIINRIYHSFCTGQGVYRWSYVCRTYCSIFILLLLFFFTNAFHVFSCVTDEQPPVLMRSHWCNGKLILKAQFITKRLNWISLFGCLCPITGNINSCWLARQHKLHGCCTSTTETKGVLEHCFQFSLLLLLYFILFIYFVDLIQLPGLFCVFCPLCCIELGKCIHPGFLCERDW